MLLCQKILHFGRLRPDFLTFFQKDDTRLIQFHAQRLRMMPS